MGRSMDKVLHLMGVGINNLLTLELMEPIMGRSMDRVLHLMGVGINNLLTLQIMAL